MRATVTLDEEKFERVAEMLNLAGKSKSEILNTALQELIKREAARRLILLGGSDPNAKAAPRRRPPRFVNEDVE